MENEELNQEADESTEVNESMPAPKSSGGGIFFALLVTTLVISGALYFAYSQEPSTIQLSSTETKQAQGIAEQRQSLAFERAKVQNEFNAQMNRIGERESALNIEAEQLCFALKRAHSIAPTKSYWLDEWRGVLKKQGN